MKVHMTIAFELLTNEHYADPYRLLLKNDTPYSNEMEFAHFLEVLPVLPIIPAQDLASTQLLGQSWLAKTSAIGFVSQPHKPIEHFFSYFTYANEDARSYDYLCSDLEHLNPSYTPPTKQKVHFENPLPYFQEAVHGLNEENVFQKFSFVKKPLSFQDFYATFVLNDPNHAGYALPYSKLKSLPALYHALKPYISQYPSYILKKNPDKYILLTKKNEQFITLSFPSFSVTTFSEGETEKLQSSIENFLQHPSSSPDDPVMVSPVSQKNYEFDLHTTALFAGELTPVPSSFNILRKIFKEIHNIRVRTFQELDEKAANQLKRKPLPMAHPFFVNMDSAPPTPDPSMLCNKEVIDSLHVENEIRRIDTIIHLKSMITSNIIESYYHPRKTENIHGSTHSLFVLPDYGELASRAPDFDSITGYYEPEIEEDF